MIYQEMLPDNRGNERDWRAHTASSAVPASLAQRSQIPPNLTGRLTASTVFLWSRLSDRVFIYGLMIAFRFDQSFVERGARRVRYQRWQIQISTDSERLV
jgi:hypothetical protein